MSASSSPPTPAAPPGAVRVFRPKLWRYAIFRAIVIAGACLTALVVVRLMETRFPIPHIRALDLAIVGGVYLALDVIYAISDRHQLALQLSSQGILIERTILGEVMIPWSRFDWSHSQQRTFLDRLLGQSYICDITGQRYLWQRVSLSPADVRAILAEFDRHADGK